MWRALIILMAMAAALSAKQANEHPGAHAQEPRHPYPYSEIQVTFANPAAPGVTLAGTITEPRKEGKLPAILLISGAGPHDRNETTAGHKPFLVLADFLTRRGFAVLRVDDRGTAESTGKFAGATTADFASDAGAAVQYLKSRTEIDSQHVGLLGHGEGATIAAMLAAKDPAIAFLVLLAAPAVPGDKILLAQTERAETAAGLPDEQIAADKKIGSALYKLVREGASVAELRQELSAHAGKLPKTVVENWEKQIDRMGNPWLRFFLSYDPQSALREVHCPVLALYGELDLQVVADQNAPEMEAALRKAHNKNASVLVLPGLNYMFQTANTGLGWEYAAIPETISPLALRAIEVWLEKHAFST